MATVSEDLNSAVGTVQAKRCLALSYHAALGGDFRALGDLARAGHLQGLGLAEQLKTQPLDAAIFKECVALAARAAPFDATAVQALRDVAFGLAQLFPFVRGTLQLFQSPAQELLEPALSEIVAGPGGVGANSVLDALYEADLRCAYTQVKPRRGTFGALLPIAVSEGKCDLVRHVLARWATPALAAAADTKGPGVPAAAISALIESSVRSRRAEPSFNVLRDFCASPEARALGVASLSADAGRRLLHSAGSDEAFLALLAIDPPRVGSPSDDESEAVSPYGLALKQGFLRSAAVLRGLGLWTDEVMALVRASFADGTVSDLALREALCATTSSIDDIASDGDRPFVLAARHGRMDLVRVLLEHGADPCLPDAKGRNALRRCPKENKSELTAILAAHAAQQAIRRVARAHNAA